jgi:hypothetical protein
LHFVDSFSCFFLSRCTSIIVHKAQIYVIELKIFHNNTKMSLRISTNFLSLDRFQEILLECKRGKSLNHTLKTELLYKYFFIILSSSFYTISLTLLRLSIKLTQGTKWVCFYGMRNFFFMVEWSNFVATNIKYWKNDLLSKRKKFIFLFISRVKNIK